MKGYRYRITVEPLHDAKGQPIDEPPLTFETENHDEILALIRRRQQRGDFEPEDQASLTLGVKLFSEVLLRERKTPLFEPLVPLFHEFMRRFKQPPDSVEHDPLEGSKSS